MKTEFRIAEWILSQVLPPERARSAVGDWREDIDQRGAIWFWCCVFRTAAAHVWSELAESAATMARLGLTGFVMTMLVPVGFTFLVSSLRHGDFKYNHDQLWSIVFIHTNQQHRPHWDVRWQINLAVILLWAACVFQTGRWIARGARP